MSKKNVKSLNLFISLCMRFFSDTKITCSIGICSLNTENLSDRYDILIISNVNTNSLSAFRISIKNNMFQKQRKFAGYKHVKSKFLCHEVKVGMSVF